MIIAIDGPAASGKGTIAKGLAKHFGYAHIDSGLFYRLYPHVLGEMGRSDQVRIEASDLEREFSKIDSDTLRSEALAIRAATFASDPAVRELVTNAIKLYSAGVLSHSTGLVIDGRDIGTVVFPQAQVKLFITASVEARAQRRHAEMVGRGEEISFEEIEADLVRRDARDMNRADAPLKAAPDALVLDTTSFDKDQAIAAAIEAVETARSSPRL